MNNVTVSMGAARSRPLVFRTPIFWAIVLVCLAMWPLASGSVFQTHLAILTCLNIIIASGLGLIARTGQLSLGHGAFVAIGAYASVLATMVFGAPFWLSALAGIVVSGLVALALGWVILRLKGVYFVLVTFAFAELVRLLLLEWPSLTGGANGISSIPAASLLGFAFDTKPSFYGFVLFIAFLCVALMYRVTQLPLGHAFDAVNDNPALADASGLSVHRLQVLAFVAGSAVGGLGGALLAHYIGFVSPESFNTSLSIAVVVMLVIGGRLSVWGPLVGAILLTPLPELFRGAVQTQHIFYGAVLIMILLLLPEGLVQLPSRIVRVFRRNE